MIKYLVNIENVKAARKDFLEILAINRCWPHSNVGACLHNLDLAQYCTGPGLLILACLHTLCNGVYNGLTTQFTFAFCMYILYTVFMHLYLFILMLEHNFLMVMRWWSFPPPKRTISHSSLLKRLATQSTERKGVEWRGAQATGTSAIWGEKSQLKNFEQLHKEWTEASVNASGSTAHWSLEKTAATVCSISNVKAPQPSMRRF